MSGSRLAFNDPETVGKNYERQLRKFIEKNKGRYVKDESGMLYVMLGHDKISLSALDDPCLVDLMVQACGVSTVSQGAKVGLQRLRVHAYKEAGHLSLRTFSSVSKDKSRLYLPLGSGKVLSIGVAKVEETENGDNLDNIWLEHPYNEGLIFEAVPAADHLEAFERLIVRTQGCQVEEMKWFIGMAEGFFPYLRELCPARFIVVHIGPSQQAGKTSGAQRFTLLHGLGSVTGDYSVASLGNMPDIGLLVMDNKEQANFDRSLTDFCLFVATGAERGRSSSEGKLRTSKGRPCAVITSIEGVSKAELQNRCVEVEYLITGKKLGRAAIEQEISEKRHQMLSAMVPVFQRFFQIQTEQRPTPNPLPQFEEHFTALCNLLRAYGDVAQKPQGWAEEIIGVWDSVLKSKEVEESELEQPVIRALEENEMEIDHQPHEYKGSRGTLYITDATTLLSMLQKLNLRDRSIPKNAKGLSRRLKGDKLRFLVLLDSNSASEVKGLRRTSKRRPIGLFIPDDVVTELKGAA